MDSNILNYLFNDVNYMNTINTINYNRKHFKNTLKMTIQHYYVVKK